ncbi:ABC transporter permease [Sediminibacillus albus]|uniref:Transport permease protein n=1 Tax=Sediminibacillus albus TaxID=407036 RepID=A0A1G8ZGF3_9BACI|nr:ABC transporter permease [Sediminibacillus albus]SDK14179.1 teichoic acid transport system permease protein [Sediminibacillus albus]
MKSAFIVFKEQVKHFYLIRRLSLYEIKSTNQGNYLGVLWEIINPLIQIAIYWFVFGYGIRERANVKLNNDLELPFVLWMVAGFVVWFFFFQSTIQASKSIYKRLRMLSKMNFPMSVIPSFVIFSQLYIHLIMIFIVMIFFILSGFSISMYYLQFIYFAFATFAFTYALALITSTLSTIVRDVHMLLAAVLRMVLYLSGILWPISSIDHATVQFIMKLNPLYYVIEGYRAGYVGTEWYFISEWEYTLYFWALTVVLFLIGSTLHVKFRRHFIDFL